MLRLILKGVPFLILVFIFSGCQQPVINYIAQTKLNNKGNVLRGVSIAMYGQQSTDAAENMAISKYLSLPPAEKYSIYKLTPSLIRYSGRFENVSVMPIDFMKKTPGINFLAQNQVRFIKRDYILLTAYDYEEKITDIVERAEAEESLKQAINLVIEAIVSTLQEEYGEKYDFSEFASYLREILPDLATSAYHIYWETRRAEYNNIAVDTNPAYELDHRIRKEISRYGIALESFLNKERRKKNDDILWAFLDSKLRNLVKAKSEDTPAMTAKVFKGKDNQIKLLFRLLQEIQKSFGSIEAFMQQLEIPLAAGAFSGLTVPFEFKGNNLQMARPEPKFNFFFKAEIPGEIVQTNGIRELDGSIIWRFNSDRVMLTGFRMWVKTLQINRDAAAKMGLNNFPGSLAAVERFNDIMVNKKGMVDEGLLSLLEKSVAEGSLTPISEATLEKMSQKTSAEAAAKLYKFLKEFQKDKISQERPIGKSEEKSDDREIKSKPKSAVLQKRDESLPVKNVDGGPELELG